MASPVSTYVKIATTAGLIGLVVLHPKPFGDLISAGVTAFRKAVNIV